MAPLSTDSTPMMPQARAVCMPTGGKDTKSIKVCTGGCMSVGKIRGRHELDDFDLRGISCMLDESYTCVLCCMCDINQIPRNSVWLTGLKTPTKFLPFC